MAYSSVDLENVEPAIIALSTGRRSTKFVSDSVVGGEYSNAELQQLWFDSQQWKIPNHVPELPSGRKHSAPH